MTQSTPDSILLIEDDPHIRKFLRISLEAHGFIVHEARLAADGLALCAAEQPDMVILDLGLPDMDGKELIQRLRDWSQLPIIVLSVRADEEEKVSALDAGANDYVTKPFGISELMARIRAILRNSERPQGEEASIFEQEGLLVDLATRSVSINGQRVSLSRKEYALLKLFITNPGRVLTHQRIMREIWGERSEDEIHHLRVLIGHLRQKLGDKPTSPRYILTEQGVGYRLLNDR